MTDKTEMLAVTPEDREAAADLLTKQLGSSAVRRAGPDKARSGASDSSLLVQAFARHRLTTEARLTPPSRKRVDLEAAAWDWIDAQYADVDAGHDPNDRAFGTDELVDAFIAGAALSATPSTPATAAVDEAAVDRAARHLRETNQAGKRLTPWADTPSSTKRKWLELARSTLNAATGEQ